MLLRQFFVQCAQSKSVFAFQLKKILVSTTIKSAQLALASLIFHSTTKKASLSLFSVAGTPGFSKKTSRNYEKENVLHFGKKSSANHNQAHPNLCQGINYLSSYSILVSTHYWLIGITKNSLSGSF